MAIASRITPGITTESGTTEVHSISNFEVSLADTLVIQAAALAAGTVLGRVTASGNLDVYNEGNSDGTEVAVGILKHDTAISTATQLVTNIIRGDFRESDLTGLDAAAKVDLAGLMTFHS